MASSETVGPSSGHAPTHAATKLFLRLSQYWYSLSQSSKTFSSISSVAFLSLEPPL